MMGPDSLRSGAPEEGGASVSAAGVTDLMTSLVVVFILLLAAHVTKVAEESREPAVSESTVVAEVKQESKSERLPVSTTNADPHVISVVVPETILNFEFGKSTLRPEADAFLADTIPQYAAILCGPQGAQVESFVIEGHTDDWGDDIHNMKLSQDRSFAVLARGLTVIRDRLPWAYECFQQKTSAIGRGRQDLLFDAAGLPDRGKSRRVIFKFHLRRA